VTVIAFAKKEPPKPRIWVCHCACEAFWLYEDGRIQCMQCDEFANTMKGQWSLVVAEPDEPA
jgi:hypothetical protein